MDLNKKYKYQFYQQQNIQLRKEIREIDLRMANSVKKQEGEEDNSCIFLVLGPSRAGKTSLLRTFQLALNGSEGWGFNNRAFITLVDIKKSPRWQVEGVKEVKQTDKKYVIQGWELISNDKPNIRYKRVLEFVEKGLGACFQQTLSLRSKVTAKLCLICIDITQQISSEELTYLRFLKLDLMERHLRILYILTKSDKLYFTLQSQKNLWLQNKINQLIKDFDIKDREDIIIFQNYKFKEARKEDNKIRVSQSSYKVEMNEQINFYSLQLMMKLINECEKVSLINAKEKKFLICGCT